MMDRIGIAVILKAELPGHTARIVDGGTITVDGETYTSRDTVLGVPVGFESLNEGVGDEAATGALTFLPGDTPSSTLNDPTWQGSRLRIWTVEFGEDSGEPIGDPVAAADFILDRPMLNFENSQRTLDLECTSTAERLFMLNTGNSLSPSFHQSIWPGEKGLANASGVGKAVAWGAAAAPRGSSTGAPGGGGGFDGGGYGGPGGGYQEQQNMQ